MKKLSIILITFLFAINFSATGQSFTAATFNLRFDNPRDSGNLWKDRAQACIDLIRFHGFEVFGVQEALHNQLEDLEKGLPDFARYGKGRDDGKTKGEHSAVFYDTRRFELLKSGDFWFSETPDVPGKGWDATCCNRISSWVQLRDKQSGKHFYFFSAHFDHQGKTAQLESAKLLVKKVSEIAGNSPAVVVGDFNVDRESQAYKTLNESARLHDAWQDVEHPYQLNGSFNNFGRNISPKTVIDHIFLTGNLEATRWGILTDTYNGKFPSDHFPVLADVKLK